MAQPVIDLPDEEFNNKKCYSCGKIFRTPANLLTHKNRKTPCLIREVLPEQVTNPNRCIFCNKILSKKEHLTRHLKICKIKNGGMDILVDKVKYDQEIRILKEQREFDRVEMENRNKEKDEKIKQLMDLQQAQAAEIDALKKAIIAPPASQTINNYNAPVFNIIINNYTSPTIEGLSISPEELTGAAKLSKLLLQKMYFNPDLPQNHCMYLQNRKDKSLIIYDKGSWRSVTGTNVPEVITNLNNTMAITGSQLINGDFGPYQGSDIEFMKLSQPDQFKLQEFNRYKDQLTHDDAYEVFLGGREAVLGTIRAAGCKLV
jgi:hypothetical protein